MIPRVSVVMPAYRAERTIGAALAGALWQTYSDLEVIVVDDGSDDATVAIVEAQPGPVRLESQSHAGVAAARNTGIRSSRTELIAFCDADDIWLEGQLQAMVGLYDRVGGIVTTDSWWLLPRGIHPTRRRYKGRFPAHRNQRMAILQQNFVSTMALFPRSLFESLGGFSEDLHRAEDWDFWARAIYSGQRVSLQPEPLSLYRWSASSLSADHADMDRSVNEVLRRLAGRSDLTEEERAYLSLRLGGASPRELAREADDHLRNRRYMSAARAYRHAARLCPAERPLVWKSRLLSLAPPFLGPLIRKRQVGIEDATGWTESHTR